MKKTVFVLGLTLLLSIVPVDLSGNSCPVAKTAEAADSGIQPYSNKTGYKYRIIDGKLYKRLWSYTYNRWEEPRWTLA